MARKFSEIQEELSGLPASERAKLALALVESLEPEEEGDIAEAWRIEAERRYEQYRRGEIQAIPGEQFSPTFAAGWGDSCAVSSGSG